MEKRKNFRAEKARKALMTLRLTQCHQNWPTILAGSANFEDKAKTKSKPNEEGSIWKGGAREQKNKLRAQRSGSQFKRKKELT